MREKLDHDEAGWIGSSAQSGSGGRFSFAKSCAPTIPAVQPIPNSQKLKPTPTQPGGPGLVATNTQPAIRPIMHASTAIVVGAIGSSSGLRTAASPAAASRPAAAISKMTNAALPAGTNASDASFLLRGPASRHMSTSAALPMYRQSASDTLRENDVQV